MSTRDPSLWTPGLGSAVLTQFFQLSESLLALMLFRTACSIREPGRARHADVQASTPGKDPSPGR